MGISALKPCDIIHNEVPISLCEYQLRVRSNMMMGDTSWTTFNVGDFTVQKSHEHLSDEAEFVVKWDANQIDEKLAAAKLRKYSECEFWVTHKGPRETGGMISTARRRFHGFIDTSVGGLKQHVLTCYDPIAFWGKCFYNVGTFEAAVLQIVSSDDDPDAHPVPGYPDVGDYPKGIPNGISLVPVDTELPGETRWVLPSSYESSPGVWTDLYQDAYTGGVSNDAYSITYNGRNWKAGSNRRSFKVAGRLFDDNLDLNSYGQDIKYPDGIPNAYYGIGTDLANYIEFYGYPPSGGSTGVVFIEFVSVYLEGTNEIEQIIMKATNPIIYGTCNVADATGITLESTRSHFIRDAITADGTYAKVVNVRTGAEALIVSVTDATHLVCAGLSGGVPDDEWKDGDAFELHNACGLSPRLINGVHYIYDPAVTYDTATRSDYFEQTVWASGSTITRIEWHVSDGSLLNFIEVLMREHAPPNWRIWWDHQRAMLRMGFVEITPFNHNTFAYGAANPVYNGFAFGKFIDDAGVEVDGEQDYCQLDAGDNPNAESNEDQFATCVHVEGTNERPVNVLKTGNAAIYAMCPGVPPSGWDFVGSSDKHWWPVFFLGDHTGNRTYADIHGGADPPIRRNLTDLVAKTCLAWENDHGSCDPEEFFPIYVIDLGQPMEVGRIKGLGMTTLRPEFNWGLRFECCTESGIIETAPASGQYQYNPSANWQLMHSSYYNYRLGGYAEFDISGGWLTNYCRYILVSMTGAKTNTITWIKAGLAELQIYRRDKVTGTARVVSLSDLAFGAVAPQTESNTDLNVAAALFSADDVGKHVANLTTGFIAEIAAFTSDTHVTTTNVGTWKVSDVVLLVDSHPIGEWTRYRVTQTDPEEFKLDGAVSLLNLPLLEAQVLGHNPSAWGTLPAKLSVGHRAVFHSDLSLSGTNACADRAEEILIEMIRELGMVGTTIKWHNEVEKFRTVRVRDKRTGIDVRGLVEVIVEKPDSITIDASVFYPWAWTGETPEALT